MTTSKLLSSSSLPEAIIYTDGSSSMGGEGGWSAIVATPFFGFEISGYEPSTTNNRMEVTAAIKAMQTLYAPHDVKLISDSAYMLNAIKNKWYEGWLAETQYKVAKNGHVMNRPNLDLWVAMQRLLCYHRVTPIKVKGHNGHAHNERADQLAVDAREQKTGRFEIIYGSGNEG
jgi:ribonuclease HI